MDYTRPKVCDRARTYVSLRLDGELSEFEGALLESHLEACGSCRAFAVEVTAITTELRAAELPRLERPLVLPSRVRTGLRGLQLGAAAAVVVTVVGAGALVSSVRSPVQEPRFSRANVSAVEPTLRELRAQDLRSAASADLPPGQKILPA
jgi:anti-sigma factor RsiW